MIYATIAVALLFGISIGRIFSLNKEIKELDAAGRKFHKVVDSKNDGSVASQEAETEYEWATNARDLKKESRTVWSGFALLFIIAMIAGIIEGLRTIS